MRNRQTDRSRDHSGRRTYQAGRLIRAQGEQIRRMTVDEYIREKTGGKEHDKSSEVFNTDFLDT